MKKILLFLLICAFSRGFAQPELKRALFLGNSYTYVNNLPMLIAGLAWSAGDSVYFDSNTPGGYTLGWQPIAHSTDSVSLEKIVGGTWDFVIIQEQSQTPAIPVLRDSCMFPGATILHNKVKSANPGAEVLFFLTWGRRFGGIQCWEPNYCSTNFSGFDQMQDSLTRSYKLVGDSLHDPIAPVGEAWRLVLGQTGMVLHDADASHPNMNGSYLAACVFYDCIFHKYSEGLTFRAGLQADSALILQKAADSIVYADPGYWNLFGNPPSGITKNQDQAEIILSKADPSGIVHTIHYEKDGTLVLYDLSGKRAASEPVVIGRVRLPEVKDGWYLWNLKQNEIIISSGKYYYEKLKDGRK